MTLTRRQVLVASAAGICSAAETPLLDRWRRIAKEIDGTVGAAAWQVGSERRISLNGNEHFPLASVCKLPIALQIFALVDEGKFRLQDEIEIPVYDVFPGNSDVAERWPKQKRFRLDELLELMLAKSDNTAVETLLRIGGGAEATTARLRQWQVNGVRIDRSERRCNLDAYGVKNIPPVSEWTPGMFEELTTHIPLPARLAAMRRFIHDPRDTATPDGTLDLLGKTFLGQLLSKGSTQRLIEMQQATTTGSARIKGMLPPGTVVAHKTGTSATVMRFNAATNDVGVIMSPRGQLALAIYVKGSTAEVAAREKAIAQIAKAAFDVNWRA